MLFEQPGRQLGPYLAHLTQIGAQIRDHLGHPVHDGFGIHGALQVAIGTIDQLGADQQVSNVLRTAEADLDQVTPAAAHSAQADSGDNEAVA